jgi:hypothetical protein
VGRVERAAPPAAVEVEVEVGIGRPSWAAVSPLDPGTEQVVRAGLRPLHDPRGLLGVLLAAPSDPHG